MRSIWVDHGQDAVYAKLTANAIASPYYDIRDPRVTLAYLNDVKARGFTPGVYANWNWDGVGSGGAAFADWLHLRLETIAPGTPADFPKVCVGMELHDAAYIARFLRRWRKHRPRRVTDWTLEGFQGGWIASAPALVDAVRDTRVGVVPQFYRGNMDPLSPGVILDLLTAGIPADRLMGFYDAAKLPYRWYGYAFTMGRLP